MQSNPKFTELVQKRSRFAWMLSLFVLTMFYGFVMLVAFQPGIIGAAIAGGSRLTVGLMAELVMFILFWLMTWMYVRRANGEFDAMTQDIVRAATSPQGGK